MCYGCLQMTKQRKAWIFQFLLLFFEGLALSATPYGVINLIAHWLPCSCVFHWHISVQLFL